MEIDNADSKRGRYKDRYRDTYRDRCRYGQIDRYIYILYVDIEIGRERKRKNEIERIWQRELGTGSLLGRQIDRQINNIRRGTHTHMYILQIFIDI